MSEKIKVAEVELSSGVEAFSELTGYSELWLLVRLHSIPLGYAKFPLTKNYLSAEEITQKIIRDLKFQILAHLLADIGFAEEPQAESIASLSGLFNNIKTSVASCSYLKLKSYPLVTVAICTRNRTESLARLLQTVAKINYPNFEVVVVDNAPSGNQTAELLAQQYPQFRYVREMLAGLDNARNRAIKEAKGEIIAFTDDDTLVDPHWLTALVANFETPDVMCVTGLVIPYQLEHEAQILFEQYGGFTRSFAHRIWHSSSRFPNHTFMFGAGEFGTGANMSFRRSLFDHVGLFDPALDVGTVTNGGGDLEMFARTLVENYTLVYEPAALVWHVHRADTAKLRYQIHGWGTGMNAFLTSAAIRYPHERKSIVNLFYIWFFKILLLRLVKQTLRRSKFRYLTLVEISGVLQGPFLYFQARRDNKVRLLQMREVGTPAEPVNSNSDNNKRLLSDKKG